MAFKITLTLLISSVVVFGAPGGNYSNSECGVGGNADGGRNQCGGGRGYGGDSNYGKGKGDLLGGFGTDLFGNVVDKFGKEFKNGVNTAGNFAADIADKAVKVFEGGLNNIGKFGNDVAQGLGKQIEGAADIAENLFGGFSDIFKGGLGGGGKVSGNVGGKEYVGGSF